MRETLANTILIDDAFLSGRCKKKKLVYVISKNKKLTQNKNKKSKRQNFFFPFQASHGTTRVEFNYNIV